MKCPLCNCDGLIKASRYVVEGDNSALEETKLFIEQDMICRNKNCGNYNKVFTIVKNPIKIGINS